MLGAIANLTLSLSAGASNKERAGERLSAMKFYETHFEEYLARHAQGSLHPDLVQLYKQNFPPTLATLHNIIFYGPRGVGKYTQMLYAIKQYSPTELKYEKKISVNYNKHTYLYKISDIHFEVDMALLGCQAKLLWNEVYNHILDIVLARGEAAGIIVCKNFQEIHSELLDCFYSYFQSGSGAPPRLKLIIVTEELSFLPENLRNCCRVIAVPRPARGAYEQCIALHETTAGAAAGGGAAASGAGAAAAAVATCPKETSCISNIKNLYAATTAGLRPHEIICRKILAGLITPTSVNFLSIRDNLYDLLIYNLNIFESIWFILAELTTHHGLSSNQLRAILQQTYTCFTLYNNNYRPIYHLERYFIFIMQTLALAPAPTLVPGTTSPIN